MVYNFGIYLVYNLVYNLVYKYTKSAQKAENLPETDKRHKSTKFTKIIKAQRIETKSCYL